jgi:hypothetical protein
VNAMARFNAHELRALPVMALRGREGA